MNGKLRKSWSLLFPNTEPRFLIRKCASSIMRAVLMVIFLVLSVVLTCSVTEGYSDAVLYLYLE